MGPSGQERSFLKNVVLIFKSHALANDSSDFGSGFFEGSVGDVEDGPAFVFLENAFGVFNFFVDVV